MIKIAEQKIDQDYCSGCGGSIEVMMLKGFSVVCPHCGGIS
jgi:predicted RNA-binding Zn-ribbon protein involved in translation (DUF1610 family)